MKDFQQSDRGGIAKSQLTTLLWFLWICYVSRKSSSNTEVGLQIILAEWKSKVWSFSQQCLEIADLLLSWFWILCLRRQLCFRPSVIYTAIITSAKYWLTRLCIDLFSWILFALLAFKHSIFYRIFWNSCGWRKIVSNF